MKLNLTWGTFMLFGFVIWANPSEELSKPLLRVFPSFRPEECEDWAIRPFICKQCLREGKRYAQLIRFFEDGPYRTHGCYKEPGGFESLEEETKTGNANPR
ncbi:hypothetical protein ND861_09175 [Leptospira sp. 2 VSF19]|uniref:Uncharacterized protein n=1 Tax=Leptospira soteropolitanensis TaxID=2950025 RepID=A0AAW5VEQ1_9LEPT|nr:hypothetical protein [Leptospira soteropolitanensis]MCW7492625.1 hypothetical protein [Leptospira soteropolitanensis]MCW7500308.1 hypothetical protein [Leptospira soteropolitanensis]MCW7522657.1 hypothetical protein [Leptospira soteropolitanensis]MCW7526513.1 hypothetical protein [Leptospira soteropolitanensis]MCW7530278.1 hypothetical protein [Leptospira soteropolitanensis]